LDVICKKIVVTVALRLPHDGRVEDAWLLVDYLRNQCFVIIRYQVSFLLMTFTESHQLA